MAQEVLIVDGYNMINAWKDLERLKNESLLHAREKLIDLLINYGSFCQLKVIIVFDGHLVKGNTGTREKIQEMEVIYTKEGETADSVIEKLVHQLYGLKLRVATSDWEEQKIVLGKGALRVSARELELQVKQAGRVIEGYYEDRAYPKGKLDHFLPEDLKQKLERWRRR
jgi:predicted RNA-binding protein with PIN domain